MEHTFKNGDRVFGQMCPSGVKTPGTFEKFAKNREDCIVHRDDGKTGIEPGLYWYASNLTTHDRDFQVGDWVRYECIKPMPLSHLLRDGMQGKVVECLKETVSVQFSEHGGLFALKSNLVKIAPPAEEEVSINIPKEVGIGPLGVEMLSDAPKTVTIEHDQWGSVEGVERAWSPRDLSHWAKEENGRKMIFNESKGWREVKPTRWVPVKIELGRTKGRTLVAYVNDPGSYPLHFNLPHGYRWGKVEIEREVEG